MKVSLSVSLTLPLLLMALTVAQFAVLGALFLMLEWIAVGLYAYLGVNLKRWLNTVQAKRRFNRACGGLLGLAGVGLLFARRGHA